MICEGDGTDEDGTNKYMGRDGMSQRGRCLAIRLDGKQALLEGITEHPGRILLVQERSEGHWPWFVGFWAEDLPVAGWRRCEDGGGRVTRLKDGKLRIGVIMRGFQLAPREVDHFIAPMQKAPLSWLDKLLANVRRLFA